MRSFALLTALLIGAGCGGDVKIPPVDPSPTMFDLPSSLTLCVGASGTLRYTYTAAGGDLDRVDLLFLADATTTLDGADGVSRQHRPESAEDIIDVEGELAMMCLSADEIVLRVTATTQRRRGSEVIERAVTVHCVPCDGGFDSGVDPRPDGGIAPWPAESFFAPLFADSIGDMVESLGGPAAMGESAVDQVAVGAEVEDQDQEAADHSFNTSTYECGEEASGMRTVCASAGVLPMPEGQLVTIVMDLDGPVPLASGDTSYVYAAVLDSDGDPANDFVPLPAYPWDYYQSTDRWYELIYSHTTGAWTVKVTQLDATGTRTEVASSVRAVIEGSRVMFFIARSELSARVPAYRTTSFRHDGAYTQATRGGDVPFADPTRSLLPLGCDYTGVECGDGALADCGADHQCATEASRGVCIPAGLSACGGVLPECPSGQTCLTEGDSIGAPAYCVTDAMLDCICAAAAGRHVFSGCP